jgi:hypothetical protein
VFIYSINEHKKDNLNRPDSESYLQSTLDEEVICVSQEI